MRVQLDLDTVDRLEVVYADRWAGVELTITRKAWDLMRNARSVTVTVDVE